MTAFDPNVPPADDPFADPAELRERLEAARTLLDGFRPIANAGRFLEPDAIEAAALLREHDVAYFFQLHEELRPHRVLRIWLRAVAAAGKGMAEGEQKIAEKTRLVALGADLLDLWHDGAEAWCSVKARGPGCSWFVSSAEARRFLLGAYGAAHQVALEDGRRVPAAPSRQAVAETVDQLEAMAFDGERRPEPSIRVAGDPERIVLDLGRADFVVVEITPNEWLTRQASPLYLRRGDGMMPLPVPVQPAGDALGELRALLGLAGHDALWALVLGFLFACFRPGRGHAVLVLCGEQGCGKTTLVRVLRMLIDPHKVDLQPTPRTEEDLFINCETQWLVAYDNISVLNQCWSDAFCRIATGSGYSKRKLFTDRGTSQFQVSRPQIVTSIVDVSAAPDLLDRSLLAQMPEIDPDDRVDDAEIIAAAERLAPACLGQLLDAAVVALRDQGEVELSERPRMLGLTRWVEAGAEVLGLKPEQFLDAYLDSQAEAVEMALSASVVGGPLKSMLDLRDICAGKIEPGDDQYPGPQGFRGTAAQLLAELNGFLAMQGKRPPRHWPETPRGMSAALRRIAPALRRLGYPVTFSRVGRGHDQHRLITIETPAFSLSTPFAKGAGDNRSHGSHRSQASCSVGNDGNGGNGTQDVRSQKANGERVCDVAARTGRARPDRAATGAPTTWSHGNGGRSSQWQGISREHARPFRPRPKRCAKEGRNRDRTILCRGCRAFCLGC